MYDIMYVAACAVSTRTIIDIDTSDTQVRGNPQSHVLVPAVFTTQMAAIMPDPGGHRPQPPAHQGGHVQNSCRCMHVMAWVSAHVYIAGHSVPATAMHASFKAF